MPIALILATLILVLGIIGFFVIKQIRLEQCKTNASKDYATLFNNAGREFICLRRGLSKDCEFSDLPLSFRNELMSAYNEGIAEAKATCYKNFF